MSKEELFQQWIKMIEAKLIVGDNLYYVSGQYRAALRIAFFSGMYASEIDGSV